MTDNDPTVDGALPSQAVDRLKKRREFRQHLLAYTLVNTFLVIIWAVTSHGFFWPAFPMGAWGIAVAVNAWEVHSRGDYGENKIRTEMQREYRT